MNDSRKIQKCISIFEKTKANIENELKEIDELNARIAQSELEHKERLEQFEREELKARINHIAEFPNSPLSQQYLREINS